MKKVSNINLGGYEFTINNDAYLKLEKYLNAIERRFSSSNGKDDIVYDIEVRLAELFTEDTEGGHIISLEKIDRIQKIMGTPKEFGDEYYAAEPEMTNSVRRLFRNPEDKVIAGVASGLSAYYGLKNPLLARALFVIIALTGIGILPYIILWLVVPKARSTSDFLAMHGEPINIETIGKAVDEGLADIKETIEDLSKSIKSKIS